MTHLAPTATGTLATLTLFGTAAFAGCGADHTSKGAGTSAASRTGLVPGTTLAPLRTTPHSAPAKSMRLGTAAAGLRAGADGSARIALAGAAVSEQVIDASGTAVAGPHELLPRHTQLGYAAAAYTPDGGVVATERRVGRGMTLRAVDRRPDGSVTTRQVISDPAAQVEQHSLTVGPTGAVAAVFVELPGDGTYRQRLAFRPAGAARFDPAITLAPDADHGETSFSVALGPDGGGVLLGLGGTGAPSFLERISPSGAVGPAITFPAPLAITSTGATAFAPDGTLAVALGLGGPSAIFLTTLAPGATSVDPVTRIAPMHQPGFDHANLAVAIDRDHHVTVMDGVDKGRLEILDSTPSGYRITALLPGNGPVSGRLVPRDDGGMTVVWVGLARRAGRGRLPEHALFGTHREPGGQFDQPHMLTTPTTRNFTIGPYPGQIAPVALTRGRVAIPFEHSSPYSGDVPSEVEDFLVVATP